jgi:hypothetical protein
MTQNEANRLIAKYKGNVPGIMNFRDHLWIIVHEPSGAEVAFTDYNQEITGCTENAASFPEFGEEIDRFGGNAYYVVGEANRRPDFVTIDGGSNEVAT